MYKTRFRLWIFIAIIYILTTILSPMIISKINYYNSFPKQAIVSVKNSQIKKQLNDKTINSTKLIVKSNSEQDIIISEGINEQNDYINQTFYSPLVAIMKSEYGATDMFETIQSLPSRNIKGLDLKKLLYCYENDLTYKEGYSTKDTNLKNKKVVLYFDSNYEKEIKYLMISCFSDHLEVTDKDVTEYGDRVNKIWESAEKIDNVSAFLKEKPVKEFIIITPEYNISADNNDLKAMSLGTTIAIDFTISCKEQFKDIVNTEKFMSLTGLRNFEYTGSSHNGNLSDADWTVDFLENKNIEDSFFKNLSLKTSKYNDNSQQNTIKEKDIKEQNDYTEESTTETDTEIDTSSAIESSPDNNLISVLMGFALLCFLIVLFFIFLT